MARLGAFSRDLQLMVDGALSPEARKGLIADAAREALQEAQDLNKAALGVVPAHEQVVDRVRGAAFETVDPDRGVIFIEFSLGIDVFEYIGRLLVEHSPVLTGEYQASHRLYADGVEVDAFDPARQAEEWVFLSNLPYARKIERGQSDQAPDGVYQSVAVMAAKRFGNVAAIKFTYRAAGQVRAYSGSRIAESKGQRGRAGGADSYPAISVRLL